MKRPIERWQAFLDSLPELPKAEAEVLEDVLLSIVGRHLVRERFPDARRFLALKEWDYLWDALASADDCVVIEPLPLWMKSVGQCWLTVDRSQTRAWRILPEQGKELKGKDVYLIPVCSPTCCYISTHEDGIGPWCLKLSDTETEYLEIHLKV